MAADNESSGVAGGGTSGPDGPLLDEELRDLARAATGGREADIAVGIWGWDRSDLTLDDMVRRWALPPDRVRQLLRRAEYDVRVARPAAPVFRRTLPRIVAELPLPADHFGTMLVEKGYASRPLSPQAILKACDLLGLPKVMRIDDSSGVELVVSARPVPGN